MTTDSTYVRVINLSIKPGRLGDLEGRFGEVADRLDSIPGLLRWTVAVEQDAQAAVAIAEYDTGENALAAAPMHAHILSDFGDYFSSPPQIRVYEVKRTLAKV